ncbi:hypothetical protein CXB51_005036 [Gossypium anomalum]|uniref:Response regulatory domain-containing protein n=1 Tax=Gossypium anomalum TaxID=47600 RepID=A0A8J5ZHE2_9ROSI|nr:hypothetical protein CXB51_005036 [Gossypium anomalum]
MATMRRVVQSSVSTSDATTTSYGGLTSCKAADIVISDQFPAGLRVLVVDDDITCLKILEQMLHRCRYHVTTCPQAKVALNLLRERKGDVYMPDMDGYKLLEHVGLEMDLHIHLFSIKTFVMSADGSTRAVMKGIRHGACDYLIKPIREEELKNIWQHVVRKKWNENKELDSGSLDDTDQHKRGHDDAEYASSVNDATDTSLKPLKKRSNSKEEDDGEIDNDDPSIKETTLELHQQFVSAVNQLGIDKAVPKRILELMNVPGLTREMLPAICRFGSSPCESDIYGLFLLFDFTLLSDLVKSIAPHPTFMQKFRLYLKRISGVAQQGGIANPLCGPVEANVKIALAASGQIPPQTLAALHAELLVVAMDQPALLQATPQGPKCIQVDHGVAFVQHLVKANPVAPNTSHNPLHLLKMLLQGSDHGPLVTLVRQDPNGNMLIDLLQQQQQLQKPQQRSTVSELRRSINVQPSCHVVPSQSSASFQAGNSPVSVTQNGSYSRTAVIDYSLISSQSNCPSLNTGQVSDAFLVVTYPLLLFLPSVSSCSVNADSCASQQVQTSSMTFKASRLLPGFVHSTSNIPDPYGSTKSGDLLNQEPFNDLGYINKGTCLPPTLAMERFFSENIGTRVKQEPSMEFGDNAKVGIPMLQQQFPPNDLMSKVNPVKLLVSLSRNTVNILIIHGWASTRHLVYGGNT